MANVTITTLANIFEKDLDPMLRDLHINANKCPLVRAIKEGRNSGEGTTPFKNYISYVTVKHGKASNVRSQATGSTLPQGRNYTDQMSFQARNINGSFQIELQAVKSTEDRDGALVNAIMDQSKDMLERGQLQMARQFNNDNTGTVALVNDATPNSKTTVTIDGVRGQDISHLVQAGDQLWIGDNTGSPFAATVSSVDSATQLTIAETTSGLSNNDAISFKDSYGSSAYQEKAGILGLVKTSGTLQGLALSTRQYLKGHVETTSETISETRLLEYLGVADANVVDASAYMVTMSNLWWKLVALIKGTAQVNNNFPKHLFAGGAEGLQMFWFGGVTPIMRDPFCHTGNANGIDLHNVGYRQSYPFELVDDAKGLAHRVSTTLDYEIAASEFGQQYIRDPRSCFRLENKTTS